MSDKTTKEKVKFNYFGTYGRIALIFFAGFSLYMFVSTVMLIFLTKPTKEITVPDVTGKRFNDTYNSLVRKGLKPELKFRDVFDYDDGIIMAQHPENGRIVAEGSTFKLTVSRSALYIDVPNLTGSELPMAINKLKNLHYHERSVSIKPGVISYIPSEKNAENIIIDQSPRSGDKITPDMKINLLVSSGKTGTDAKMPAVTGQSIELCYDLLLAKGLTVVCDITESSDKKSSGIIISQSRNPGEIIQKNSIVNLKVAHYPLKEHPFVAYEKFEYQLPSDEKEGLYEAYVDDNKSKRIRFAQKLKPGQTIKFVFERVGNAKVLILRDKNQIKVTKINVE